MEAERMLSKWRRQVHLFQVGLSFLAASVLMSLGLLAFLHALR